MNYSDKTNVNNDWKTSCDSKDLIYNRFDIIYGTDYDSICVSYNGQEYLIKCHIEEGIAKLDIWGKHIPDKVMEDVIAQIESRYPDVLWIDITRGLSCYRGELLKGKETILFLPDNKEQLLLRLNSKERSRIRLKRKHLGENGEIKAKCFQDPIPEYLINQYFEWKKNTHEIDYCLKPDEYIREYHVTNAMALYTSLDRLVSVLFFCKVNQTVYFENFSYDTQWKKYSPGYILYINFLLELVDEGCTTVFLGGGDYEYKKKFRSVSRDCYSGTIFCQTGLRMLNDWFISRGIRELAIYGLGNLGHAVMNIIQRLNVVVEYGIDKNENNDLEIKTYNFKEELPPNDLVLITVKKKDTEIESYLESKKMKYIYWDELTKDIKTIFTNRG